MSRNNIGSEHFCTRFAHDDRVVCRQITGSKGMKVMHRSDTKAALWARRTPFLTGAVLGATTVLLASPLTVAWADSPAATSQRAGVNLPRGAERKTDGDLPARFGRLLRSAGKEVKAPAGDDAAEVLVWTVKSGRARF